jgi:hypothetical protein
MDKAPGREFQQAAWIAPFHNQEKKFLHISMDTTTFGYPAFFWGTYLRGINLRSMPC